METNHTALGCIYFCSSQVPLALEKTTNAMCSSLVAWCGNKTREAFRSKAGYSIPLVELEYLQLVLVEKYIENQQEKKNPTQTK